MNALGNQRRVRKTQPTLEYLDLRIAPTTISPVANPAAEIRVESRQVVRWEASLETTPRHSREHRFLINHIARTDARIAVQEASLARMEMDRMALANAANGAQQPVAPQGTSASNPVATVRPGHPVPPLEPFTDGTVQSSSPSSSGSTTSGSTSTTPTTTTTTLPANESPALGVIYAAYEANPSDFPADIPVTDGATLVQIQGTSVGISVKDSNAADFNTLVTSLQNAGMQITASSATYGIVEGFLPVAHSRRSSRSPMRPV